jgi:hypothetical protein
MVCSVRLSLRSWYGHPEADVVEAAYQAAKQRAEDDGDITPPLGWTSGLRCWDLLDEDGLMIGRAYEPTAQTPGWVWVDERGDQGISQPLTMAKLTALIVEHRLMGGIE